MERPVPKNQMAMLSAFTMLATIFAVYSWVALGTDSGPTEPDWVVVDTEKKHLVTPEMRLATEKAAHTTAPAFRAEATDGKTYDLAEMVGEGPVALVFIKEGCPCSVESQPFFNRLHEAYGAAVPFFGVIDAPVGRAGKWAEVNHAAFPLLSDVELKIVHDYKAESSAYLAVVSKGGAIEKLWPGYSAAMIREASACLAKLAEIEPKPIDATGAPEEMLTGCPF
jgi:peroxiredoxin